jgi:hypothetical protein
MLAFRSVVSVLVSFVRSFSANSRPALRAACGRPPAALRPGNDTTVTGEPASPCGPVAYRAGYQILRTAYHGGRPGGV